MELLPLSVQILSPDVLAAFFLRELQLLFS